jgi:hypothetical protein
MNKNKKKHEKKNKTNLHLYFVKKGMNKNNILVEITYQLNQIKNFKKKKKKIFKQRYIPTFCIC